MAEAAAWELFDFRGTGTWPETWPPVEYRAESERLLHLRVVPQQQHGNRLGAVHGAFLAALAENCLQLPLEKRPEAAVTVSLSFDYPASARIGIALGGELRVVRETGKLLFVAIQFEQEGEVVIHGTGIVRKLMPR